MIACDRCNTENLDGSQYCDECGAPLGANGSAPKFSSEEIASSSSVDRMMSESPEVAADSEVSQESVNKGNGKRRDAVLDLDDAHAKLVIERGRSAGKQFPLSDDESQIGRWDADGGIFPDVDLDADDPEAKVSRRHARIMRHDNQYFVEDLGSTNGTFINRGRRLLPGDRQPLRDGDEIIVGKTFLRFHIVK